MNVERVIIVVLDGVGAGELPDAGDYGDCGSSTIVNTAAAVGGLRVPNLGSLGLGRILPIAGVPPAAPARGFFGRLAEASPGKDSVTGHWEVMGIVLDRPFPTYPGGFPHDVISRFEAAIHRKTIGNVPASGTEIISQLGEEHLRTGSPIVYTSADSVFQIAAHEDVIPVERLYEMCETARALLTGEHAVGRVIARPFTGQPGSFRRTEQRRDYPLTPPSNLLDALSESGRQVHGIGKVAEFFNGRGIAISEPTTNNADHCRALLDAIRTSDAVLVFANLEDFDMLYGHRNDVQGFADALEEFDRAVGPMLEALRPGDLLLLTDDHGNDPTTPSTDHSREYAFLLGCGQAVRADVDLGVRSSFADIGATVREVFGLPPAEHGISFLSEITIDPSGSTL